MVLDVLFDHFSSDITSGADKVPTGPEMLAPVLFFKFGEFHLEFARSFTFDVFHERRDRSSGIDGHKKMDVIWSHCS